MELHAIPLSMMRYYVYGVLLPVGKQNLILSIHSFWHAWSFMVLVTEQQKRNLKENVNNKYQTSKIPFSHNFPPNAPIVD